MWNILRRMSETPVSLLDVAQVAVEDFRRGSGRALTPDMAAELANVIELALLTAVRGERRAGAAECERRAELWERTGDKPDTSPMLRAEARARAAEARYLADLIAARR
jgi:alkanesulfonate monooxygenase SsuD/methylene tetrahydromethanopterin reductase-like flavin-dependent oxidoreductase (luciferase family)